MRIQDTMRILHELIWERLIHPDVHMIYDYMAPPGEPDKWEHLPTPEEIKDNNPNACGWQTGMEDCSINGGAYLAGLVNRYSITNLPEHAGEARTIYQGLKMLGTVSPRKGFIARGVLPDGISHYCNSSVDQYTLYVYGVWRYYHSSIATEKEKSEIEEIINNICTRIEEDGFDILREDGKPALVSDIGAIRSDRSSRLLEMFIAGYDITSNKHWLEIYREKLKENDYARLRDIITPSRIEGLYADSKPNAYVILQNQVSLMPLFEIETDMAIKSCYLEAIRLNAKLIEDQVLWFRNYDPNLHTDDYELGRWRVGEPGLPETMKGCFKPVRSACESMVVMLLANDKYLIEPYEGVQEKFYSDYLRNICRELLLTYDYDKIRTFEMIYAEIAYWFAVKQGMFEYYK